MTMMHRSNIFLAFLSLSQCSHVASFQRIGSTSLLNSPHALKAIQIRGGDDPDKVDIDIDIDVTTSTTYESSTTEVTYGSTTEDVVSTPTYQKYMQKIRQPTYDTYDIETEIKNTDFGNEETPTTTISTGASSFAFLSSLSFSSIVRETNYFYGSLIDAYPAMKYVIAIVFAAIVVKVLAMLVDNPEEPQIVDPAVLPPIDEPIDNPDNCVQATIALVVGGIGLLAGSLAVGSECSQESAICPPVIPPEEEETDDTCKTVAIKAGGATLAAGVASRAMIIGKVLSIWF